MAGVGLLIAAVGMLLPASDPAAPEARLMLQERAPLVLIVDTPSNKSQAVLGASEIIRAVTDLLRAHTNLYAQISDPRLIKTCRGKLGCMVEELRSDFDHYLLFEANGDLRPYDQHLRKLALNQVSYARYLLWITDVAQGGGDTLTVWLIDTDAAMSALHAAPRTSKDWRDRCEPEVRRLAGTVGSIKLDVASPAELAAHAQAIFEQQLAKVFDQSFNWEPYGELLIETPYDGAAITIDGVVVGTTKPGLTRLSGITQGVREIGVQRPDAPLFSTTIEILRQHVVGVLVSAPPAKPRVAEWIHPFLMVLGSAAVAGGVLSILLTPKVAVGATEPTIPLGAGLISAGAGVAVSAVILDDPGVLMLSIGGSLLGGVLVGGVVGVAIH